MTDFHETGTSHDRVKEFHSATNAAEEQFSIFEYLLIIVNQKKMICLACLTAFIVTFGITLLMPNIYTSTARILPPQEQKAPINFMSAGLNDLAAMSGLSVGGGTGELYVGLLHSRSISDAIIDRFKLMEVYGQEYRMDTYEELNEKVIASLNNDNGIVSISVEDTDPVRAKEMANAYIEELKKLNIRLNLSTAGRERVFLEKRLSLVMTDLKAAEEKLKEFQKKNKTIQIDVQTTVIIEAIANLKAELANQEVQLGVLKSSQTEHNPELMELRESIAELKKQIEKLETVSPEETAGNVMASTSDVPELAVQYARLLRDLKVQETLFELLRKQYETAKLVEAKNTSPIEVLDMAQVPDKKTKPKRVLLVLATTFVVGLFSILWAFTREYAQRMPENKRQIWAEIKRHAGFRK